ncbi:MAG: GNAT family N-acetyltransferase [Candidatus Thermoplasmatota archaeon]|nr:GNAT family N-acetyltransferase [Candidatus Thermoplasmatota archaeon]
MDIKIRDLKEDDLRESAALIVRLKKFNSEHDPLFLLNDKIEEAVNAYLKSSLRLENRDALVAEHLGKIVGVVMADIVDRMFYEPLKEARITELYVLPEFRKTGLGKKLIEAVAEKEKKRGCAMISVEFPTENLVAHKFYTGIGMRSVISIYGKKIN